MAELLDRKVAYKRFMLSKLLELSGIFLKLNQKTTELDDLKYIFLTKLWLEICLKNLVRLGFNNQNKKTKRNQTKKSIIN